MAYINFTTVSKKGAETEYNNAACFASANWGDAVYAPYALKYPATCYSPASHTRFWIAAWMRFLDDSLFTVNPIDGWSKVEFWLKTEGMTYRKALVYLTAFRYPYEGAGALALFYEDSWNAGKSDEEMFAHFMKTHSKALSNGSTPMSGHSLFNSYYPKPNLSLTLAEFKQNLADPEIQTVNDHFV